MTTEIWLLLIGTVVAGFVQGLSGFAFGMAAMSIWVWGVEPIQNFNLAALSMTMAAYLFTGTVTRDMIPLFAMVAPALLIPSLLGARLYKGLSETGFRRVVLSLLTASGLMMVVSALPALLRSP